MWRWWGCWKVALPELWVIVCHFYDVESGRMELDQRGRGTGYERFDIPIARDGGIADLLAEAKRPNRRFDVVICESSWGGHLHPRAGGQQHRRTLLRLQGEEDPTPQPGQGREGAHHRHNPPEMWVWSVESAHEPLIPKWMFDAINNVGGKEEGLT
jgi:hypothetical protein